MYWKLQKKISRFCLELESVSRTERLGFKRANLTLWNKQIIDASQIIGSVLGQFLLSLPQNFPMIILIFFFEVFGKTDLQHKFIFYVICVV